MPKSIVSCPKTSVKPNYISGIIIDTKRVRYTALNQHCVMFFNAQLLPPPPVPNPH